MTRLHDAPWTPEVERLVRQALIGLRFGTVTLILQDSRVIQVDRSEKFRINRELTAAEESNVGATLQWRRLRCF